MDTDTILPSEQGTWEDLQPLSARVLHQRREWIFLILSGVFLGTLSMLNLIGLTRFLDLSLEIPLTEISIPMPLAVGVLPYPITFLCTDLISELFGQRRANQVVWVGLGLNLWIVAILLIGDALPAHPSPVFDGMRTMALGSVSASMAAYLLAQLIDVRIFHALKRKTEGRHLWLRNNGSTLVSQWVDTSVVILIAHFQAHALPIDAGEPLAPQLLKFIAAGYLFKFIVALLDTVPMYVATRRLQRYLRLPRSHEKTP